MKESKFRVAVFIGLGILVCITSFAIYLQSRAPKLAYVRSNVLIEKYQGTLEARKNFEAKKSGLMANVDSLKLNFDRTRSAYFSNIHKLSPKQREIQEKSLLLQQNQLNKYSDAIDEKIQEEDNKVMQEVLNQINSYVEEYSKEMNYDIVLGTTLSGSLLYGHESFDITDDLLDKLNKKYKGK